MGELGINKIAGAILATALGIMGFNELSLVVFGGGHKAKHGDEAHHGEELSASLAAKYAYYTEIAQTGGPVEVEEVFDLGALLASADVDRGARSFRAKCASCHTVELGGANGTGPNLWDIVGRGVGGLDGFGYSNAFAEYGGAWTHANLDTYLENPRGYINGTAMAFAGLKKDPERMNVIAYLTALSDAPVAFPDPLPVVEEVLADGEGAVLEDASLEDGSVEVTDGVVLEGDGTDGTALTDAVETLTEAGNDAIDAGTEVVTDTVETVTEEVTDAGETLTDAVDEVTETVEDMADATEGQDE